MIYGLLHPGSGLGNQLHRYVATRALAESKGYDFSMIGKENFKGKSFMSLDLGKDIGRNWDFITDTAGKIIVDTHFDSTEEFHEITNYYNPEFNFIEDNIMIDGEFQDERYWNKHDVKKWLEVEPLYVPDGVCLIGFRGGEFYMFPELGLPEEYFKRGMEMMLTINPGMKFEVHTDDLELAQKFFSNFIREYTSEITFIHDIGINWRSMRFAKYAIIANSSFYIFPRWISGGITIAPRYWARYNTKEWSMPQNYYDKFTYI